ncbi:MAG: CotH kinase family protein, partial [Verrucomicrobiota bacterium]
MGRISVGIFPILTLCLLAGASLAQADVIINEIMYHIPEKDSREPSELEFVELHNTGENGISLEGWAFTTGIRFVFPEVTIEAGGYLVVVADPDAFQKHYSSAPKGLGPFKGRLGNSGERVALKNAARKKIDEVRYADQGFWATRNLGKLKGYPDWVWKAEHDGGGASLELINPAMTNEEGHNWMASLNPGGTPGEINSVFSNDAAPLIVSLRHEPLVPKSSETVRVEAGFDDERPGGLKAVLHYRLDSEEGFREIPMEPASGGRWAGTIPPQEDGQLVHFRVEVTDGRGQGRVFPASNGQSNGRKGRLPTCLYQVDNGFDLESLRQAGSRPQFRLLMADVEMELLKELAGISGRGRVYNNHYNMTVITIDGDAVKCRYQVDARIRGHGSRSSFPPGLRVSFPSDDRWKGIQDFNLNTQFTQSQALGAVIQRLAGIPSARSTPIHVRINGEDWAAPGSPQFGCYVLNEVLDAEFVERCFPDETDGNLYRGVGNANLNNMGDRPDRYRTLYRKRNHKSQADYSDLIALVEALDPREPTDDFLSRVKEIVDIKQWARYIALDALLGNTEGGLSSGRGDDYAFFRRGDGRFQLIPYDLDSILGMGDDGADYNNLLTTYGNMQGFRRLFKEPEFIELLHGQVRELTETVFRPEVLNRVIDDVLGGWIPESADSPPALQKSIVPQLSGRLIRGRSGSRRNAGNIADIKAYIPKRIANVLGQIDSGGSAGLGVTLPFERGYRRATNESFAIYGRFGGGAGASVTVGGRIPRMIRESGHWIMGPGEVAGLVRSGINQVPVVTRNGDGDIVGKEVITIWMDQGDVSPVEGSVSGRWSVGESPYLLRGAVRIPRGESLTVEAGVTVYAAPGSQLLVEGRLVVDGKDDERVHMTMDPNAGPDSRWKGIRFEGGEHHLAYLVLHGASGNSVHGISSRLVLKGCEIRSHGTSVFGEDSVLEVAGSGFENVESGTVLSSGGGTVRLEESKLRGRPGGKEEEPLVMLKNVDAASSIVFANRFEGNATGLWVDTPIFVDGNDFLPSDGRTDGAIGIGDLASGEIWVTRNRLLGKGVLVSNSVTGLRVGNNETLEAAFLSRRPVPAEVSLLNQPPSMSGAEASLVLGGAGLTRFRYRVDDQPWSEPVHLNTTKVGEAR